MDRALLALIGLFFIGILGGMAMVSGGGYPIILLGAILLCALCIFILIYKNSARVKTALALFLVGFSIVNLVAIISNPARFDVSAEKKIYMIPSFRQVPYNYSADGSPYQFELFILEMIREKTLIMSPDSEYILLADYAKDSQFEDIQYMPEMEEPDFFSDRFFMFKEFCAIYYGDVNASFSNCSMWLENIEETEALVMFNKGYTDFYVMPVEIYRQWEDDRV